MGPADWTEDTWSSLVARLRKGRVTPFLGAGASVDIVGGSETIAANWARSAKYPFTHDLLLKSIAQYVAIEADRASAGEFIERALTPLLGDFVVENLADPHHVYRYLPTLDLPLWITTNYDDLIERALRAVYPKSPQRAISNWTPPDSGRDVEPFDESLVPTAKRPLVFYLHGSYRDDLSMVITEDDYLDFIERMSDEPGVVPPAVELAFRESSMLFIGYGFRDLNLQLFLRRLQLKRAVYAVQPFPAGFSPTERTAWADYYPKYLESVTGAKVIPYWGTASEFCTDLEARLTTEVSA